MWLAGSQGRLMARSQVADKQYSLARIAVFAELPPDGVKRIEQRCAWRRYEPGEQIVNYLDASDDVFFISVGEVRVTIYSSAGKSAGKAVSFTELRAGAIFGEYPAIDGGPRERGGEDELSYRLNVWQHVSRAGRNGARSCTGVAAGTREDHSWAQYPRVRIQHACREQSHSG